MPVPREDLARIIARVSAAGLNHSDSGVRSGSLELARFLAQGRRGLSLCEQHDETGHLTVTLSTINCLDVILALDHALEAGVDDTDRAEIIHWQIALDLGIPYNENALAG